MIALELLNMVVSLFSINKTTVFVTPIVAPNLDDVVSDVHAACRETALIVGNISGSYYLLSHTIPVEYHLSIGTCHLQSVILICAAQF